MTQESWHYAEADAGGFTSFETLKKEARDLGREGFLEKFPVAALLVVHRDADSTRSSVLDPSSEGVQLLTISIKSAAILRYLNRIAFLAKRPGNPYAHLVSVGRSASNDIAIAVDSVSKVHGYFSREGESWAFTDHSSTNGSLINDQPLEAGQKQLLADGDFLRLGLEVTLELFSPERLYERLVSV